MAKKFTVAVLGAGNMGTALAHIIAKNGFKVNLWNHEGDVESLKQIITSGENKKYLSGIKLSKNIIPEFDLEKSLSGVQAVFFAIPSNFMATLVERAVKFLPCGVVCVDASKGIDEKSLFLVSDIIESKMPKCLRGFVVSISGPAIARDMAEGKFTAMAVSSKNKKAIEITRYILENDNLKLQPTTDVVGVEITGSFKNVYAIAMGICDGLEMPMNTKAALLVTALKEIGMLVKKMGGKEETVYGLSGLGDLVGTGLCEISRNRRFGEYLAKGKDRASALKEVGQTVEGITAVKTLLSLGKKYKIQLPFAQMVYKSVWQEKDCKKTLINFLKNFNA